MKQADTDFAFRLLENYAEALPEEEIAGKRRLAEELLAQLQAAEDPEALFDQLAGQYSEDSGRAANPRGYVVTPDSSFVTSFKETALSLAPGELSGIVESEYGFHILLRRSLWEVLEGSEEQRRNLADIWLGGELERRIDKMEAVFSEKLDSFDAGAFYQSYTEALAAREAAAAADGQEGQ